MDYDSKDFHNHKLQLSGEDSTILSPGLGSYALPKFDFEDSLSVHLRFDSLVETEALFGIQTQEENQWIQEFSRGSTAIQLGSCAAESCSILRPRNVWSEVTSSESVEMLLKSVGQEEMITGKTINEDSDALNRVVSSNNLMESSVHVVGSVPSKMDDGLKVDPTSSCDNCVGSLSAMGSDVEMESSHVEATLVTHEAEKFRDGGLVGQNSVSDNCRLPTTGGNLLINAKKYDTGQDEGDNLVLASVSNKAEDVFAISVMHSNNLITSGQTNFENVGESSNQDAQKQEIVNYNENPAGSVKNENVDVVEDLVYSERSQIGEQYCVGNDVGICDINVTNGCTLASEGDSKLEMLEGNVIDCDTKEGDSSFDLAVKASSVVKVADSSCRSQSACSKNFIQFGEVDGLVLSEYTEIGKKPLENVHEVNECEVLVSSNDPKLLRGNLQELSAVVAESYNSSEKRVVDGRLEPVNVSCVGKQEQLLYGGCYQVETEISLTTVSKVEANELSKSCCDGSRNGVIGCVPRTVMETNYSAYIPCETELAIEIKDGCRGFRVEEEDIKAQGHAFSSMQVKPTNVCEANMVNGSSNVHNGNTDVFSLENEKVAGPFDYRNMDSESGGNFMVDKRVAPPDLHQNDLNIAVEAHESYAGITGDELEGTATEGRKPEEEGYLSACVVDITDLQNKEEAASGNSLGPNLLNQEGCSQLACEPVFVSACKQRSSSKSAKKFICEAVSLSSSILETNGSTCQNDSQDLVACEGMASSKIQALGHPMLCPSMECSYVVGQNDQKDNDAKFVYGDNSRGHLSLARDEDASNCNYVSSTLSSLFEGPEQAKILAPDVGISLKNNKSHCDGLEIGSWCLNSDGFEPNCGSTTIISCSMLSQSDKKKQEGSNVPSYDGKDDIVNIMESTFHVPNRNSVSKSGRNLTFEISSLAGISARTSENGRKPCDSVQSYESVIVECSDSRTSGSFKREPKLSQKTSLQSSLAPPASDSSNMSGGSEVSSDCLSSERKIDKEGKSIKEAISEKHMTEERYKSSGVALNSKGPEKQGMLVKNSLPSGHIDDNCMNLDTQVEGSPKVSLACWANGRKAVEEEMSVKEIMCGRQMAKEKCSLSAMAPSSTGEQRMHAKTLESCGHIDEKCTKSCSISTLQTSKLLDLNISASPPVQFLQHLTNLQQVQLRAQIFVYGSLNQGVAPDEMCMVLAFGESDGGRSAWEHVWRVAVERLKNQNSLFMGPETPLPYKSCAQFAEQAAAQNALQNNAYSTPAGRTISKCGPSASLIPMADEFTSLWSISTPLDGMWSSGIPRGISLDSDPPISSFLSYPSPHQINSMGCNTSWSYQVAFQGPSVFSPPRSTPGAASLYSALPNPQTVHVTSARESPLTPPSMMQDASPLVHDGNSKMSAHVASVPLLDVKNTAILPGKHSPADLNLEKRKKDSNCEEFGPICLFTQTEGEAASSSCMAFTNAHISTHKASSCSIKAATPNSSTHYFIAGVQGTEPRVRLLEEMCSKLEETKLLVEDVTTFAATAVNHSHGIWDQLADLKNSGLGSKNEGILVSAALSISAAASVANAATAAAKVAVDAALQATMMADEALLSSRNGSSAKCKEPCHSDGACISGSITLASILKDKDKASSSSSIIAAEEVARRRFEASSSAVKQAENLDAVVKAAKMAAEAVSQTGSIIAMGDPIPFSISRLVEFGPLGYWKVVEHFSKQFSEAGDIYIGKQSYVDDVGLDISAKQSNEQPSSTQKLRITDQMQPFPKEMSLLSPENHTCFVSRVHSDYLANVGKELEEDRGHKAYDIDRTISVVPEDENISTSSFTKMQKECNEQLELGTSKENSIREGSLVEVLSDGNGSGRAWSIAKVLSLKDAKAYVSFTELPSHDGSRQLSEWVALEIRGTNGPRIRMTRSCTSIKCEGTRKRGKAAIREYHWSIGDRVDAWINDSWREGIIADKSKEDVASFTVHFPVEEDRLTVRAWHLRSSLIWKDGEWVEWSSLMEHNYFCHEGDGPQVKRLKLSDTGGKIYPVEAIYEDKKSAIITNEESGKLGEKSLALCPTEVASNVMKNLREENKFDSHRWKLTAGQKEGPKVKFGVPKPEPGKKQKFKEVSKHFHAYGTGKMNNDVSDKLSKYLMPQGSKSHASKNMSKVGSKEKRPPVSKPKVLESGKPPSFSGRSITPKDNFFNVQSHPLDVNASNSRNDSMFKKQNLIQTYNTHKTFEDSKLSSTAEAGQNCTGKLSHCGENLSIKGGKATNYNSCYGKSRSKDVETRRSTRKIQPTSRLLEGIQSSSISSRNLAATRDKGSKALQWGASTSRGTF